MGDRPLLERDRELAALDTLLAGALAGRAGLALVEGPAGIGKSRLVAEARRRAADAGLRVLGARGGELEREFPFGVVRQLFEPVLADPEARERALAGAANPARAVFESPSEPAAGETVGGDASFATLHGLYWLVANLAEDGPLLLAVDDLHWCDRPSLRYLAYLVRRLEGLPLAVVSSLRPGEPGADATLLAEIAGDPLTAPLRPGPLSYGAVAELVHERLEEAGAETFLTACHTATGGNPLLLEELLRAMRAEGVSPNAAHAGLVREVGPRAVSRAVLLRLARLPVEARAVARAAAVLGDGATLSAVAALAGLDEASAAQGVGALARAEIVRSEPPLGFVHPLVRDAVYVDVPPGERELEHERAARLLTDAGAADEQVAAHLLVIPARGDSWVVGTLTRAARVALRKGAAESAVSYLTRALAEPPPAAERPKVLFDLGLTETLTYGPAAIEHLREAHAALRDPLERGIAANALARTLYFMRLPEDAFELARRAAAELPPELSDLRQQLEAVELIGVVFGAALDAEALGRLERYRTRRDGDGVGTRMLASVSAWDWATVDGPADACAELALEAVGDGVLVSADPGMMAIPAIVTLAVADREEASEIWEAAHRDAHVGGSAFAVSSINLWRGYTLYLRGELREAEDQLRACVEALELWGDPQPGRGYGDAILAEMLLERGDLDGARRLLGHVGEPDDGALAGTSASPPPGRGFLLRARLRVLLAEGRADEAVEVADELAEWMGRRDNPAYVPWRSLKAEALDRLGRREEALTLARAELGRARAFGAPRALGRSLRVLGTLERQDGLGLLEEAVAVLEPSPARLEHAKALAALGSALRHARRPTDAREPLRRALELAAVCGAGALVESARSELHATGARPRREALSGLGSLTPSERRVADLATTGQTNRDIAQTLFVTPKTVEVHLSRVYRKLGIRSRRELPAAIERQQP